MLLTDLDVDAREPSYILDRLVELGVPVNLTRMETGDYCFLVIDDNKTTEVLIERASWSNLLQKIGSGELADQMRRALSGDRLVLLLIEGDIVLRDDTIALAHHPGHFVDTGWKYTSVSNYLLSLEMAGVITVFSPSKTQTAKRLQQIYEFMAKNKHTVLSKPYRPMAPSFYDPSPQEMALTSIPGVGPELAQALLGEYKGLGGIINATEKELMGIPGVGRVKARQIKEFFS